jgi:glycosyltransferase involved in cell wall biosynthesis
MNPLRILHATPAFAPAYRYGGPIRSIEGLVVELARQGVDVRVLATDAHRGQRLDVGRGWQTWRGVPVRDLRRALEPDLAPAFLWESYREARRADLVHVLGLFSVPSMIALVAAELAGTPVVLSPRGTLEPAALEHGAASRKRAWLRAFRPALERASFLHATSEAEAASIARVLGPGARVRVVPNGTDLEPTAESLARKARAADVPRVGALGRVHPIKMLDRLVEAARLLRGRGVELEVVLAGPPQDQAYLAKLRRMIDDDGDLAGRVTFAGELRGEAKLDFLAGCRVLALPSASENFGNVVIEALAARTPVVAGRGTPWAELEARGAGRWVDNDAHSLADALEPYLRDPGGARSAGERGRALVEERYTWSAVTAAMIDAYREAVASSPRRP